jgi:hypothetical protein
MQYNTRNKWYFDAVLQINSRKRMPYYSTVNHAIHPGYSPTYAVFNVQIRKVMSAAFEWYIGGENLGNVQQHHPVMKKLKRKVIYYLPYAEIGKPFKTSDYLTY